MLACCLAVSGALGAGTALAEANPAAPTGQYEEALVRSAEKELRLARRHGADDIYTLVPLAKAFLLQGQHEKVLPEIRRGGGTAEGEAAILVVRGQAHLALSHLDEAETAFADAADLEPDEVPPLLGLAKVALSRGDPDRAESLAGRALALGPEDAEAWFVKGEIRRRTRDLEGAVASYDKAIQFEPRYVPARIARAGSLIDLGRHDSAEGDIEFVRARNPRDPQAAYFHALVLANAGDMKGAQAVLREASQILESLDPAIVRNDPPTLLLAGVVAYFQKDHETAYHALNRFVGLVPNHPGARKLLGSLLLRMGQPLEAVDVLEKAVALVPEDPELLATLASALMRSGRYADATAMFEKAIAAAPEAPSLRTQLALTRLATGEQEQAVKDLESALAIDPDATQAAILLTLTHLRKGDHEAALSAAQELARRNPDNPFAHNVAGGAQLGVGDRDTARRSFERALEIDANYLPALHNLAHLDLHQGNLGPARVRYRAILEREAKEVRAMIALSEIAEREEQPEEAVRWLEKARVTDSKLAAPLVRLVGLYVALGEPESALATARALRERDPANAVLMEAEGRAQLALGKPERAAALFHRIAEISAEAGAAAGLVRVAKLQVVAKDVEGAQDSLNEALNVQAEFLPAHAALFEIEVRAGKLAAARARAEGLRAAHPQSALGDTLVGDVLMRERGFAAAADAYMAGLGKEPNSALALRVYRARRAAGQDAMPFIEGWVAEHPDDLAARRALAAGYINTGNLDAAIDHHEHLLAEVPDDPALLNNLASLYQRTGDPRALRYAERAYAISPEEPATMDTYGWILMRQGEAAQGLKLLRNAHIRAPSVREIRYHTAVALDRLGQGAEARRELQAALKSGADFEGAAEARALLRKLSGKAK